LDAPFLADFFDAPPRLDADFFDGRPRFDEVPDDDPRLDAPFLAGRPRLAAPFFAAPFLAAPFLAALFLPPPPFDPPLEPPLDAPFLGTFSPRSRASESPIAIACFRDLTFLPLRPLFNCPRFISCMDSSTFFPAPFEYLAIIENLNGLINQKSLNFYATVRRRISKPLLS
jgi:hypothetical protein